MSVESSKSGTTKTWELVPWLKREAIKFVLLQISVVVSCVVLMFLWPALTFQTCLRIMASVYLISWALSVSRNIFS